MRILILTLKGQKWQDLCEILQMHCVRLSGFAGRLAMRNELNAMHADMIAHNAYETMRNLNLVNKDKSLLVFYHRIGDRIQYMQ